MLDERFTSAELDRSVWVPWYLPHWSSRTRSAATYEVGGGELRLSIPADQPLWAEGIHETPLRVSGIQSANYSGSVGSTVGGQPFRDGLEVREEQGEFWGVTPLYSDVEITMRGVITPWSMVAFWLAGVETAPELSGEICVMEVFGTAPHEIGMGLHRFRDPNLTEDWGTVTHSLDISDFHTYGVKWRRESLAFTIDGEVVKRVDQAPQYPMQLQIAVFDFPDRADLVDGPVPVPELIVSRVTCS
ncbi:Glycosyl hydrolases family 16 [Paractinoplanes atraurantiacus]|uniref:Glycosyl hydrolases family 16 n=1 Tax=Paractinoplanes atraurantiacus TaxID=1036182 RepID=A0A285JGC4_9ACTN|nr:Glycosyl hydrolases family 16 [Actinoplanes atraurantiacus]